MDSGTESASKPVTEYVVVLGGLNRPVRFIVSESKIFPTLRKAVIEAHRLLRLFVGINISIHAVQRMYRTSTIIEVNALYRCGSPKLRPSERMEAMLRSRKSFDD